MTLIVTALTQQFAVQLSDMRLTNIQTQAVLHEAQNKTTVLTTHDARLLVGWCGFATDTNKNHDTGDWLVKELVRLATRQPALRFPDFISQLVSSATAQFEFIAEPLDDKACTIVFAGWASPRRDIAMPIAVQVSNCVDERWQRLPHTRRAFCSAWLWPSEKSTRDPALVIFSGAQQAATAELGNAIGLLLRRVPSPTEVMNACRRVMKEATANPTYGGLIGRNWVGAEIHLDSPEALAYYFPEQDSPQQFMPNFVTPQQSFKDVVFWGGPGEPSWWKR